MSLWVSSGMTKVPSGLIGKSKDEAVDELQKNGFAVEINTENSSQPENTVTRIEPNEGTSVERGASVTIWVSNGKVAVPNVVGRYTRGSQGRTHRFGSQPQVEGGSQ